VPASTVRVARAERRAQRWVITLEAMADNAHPEASKIDGILPAGLVPADAVPEP